MELEATVLPTEPQPLPKRCAFIKLKRLLYYKRPFLVVPLKVEI